MGWWTPCRATKISARESRTRHQQQQCNPPDIRGRHYTGMTTSREGSSRWPDRPQQAISQTQTQTQTQRQGQTPCTLFSHLPSQHRLSPPPAPLLTSGVTEAGAQTLIGLKDSPSLTALSLDVGDRDLMASLSQPLLHRSPLLASSALRLLQIPTVPAPVVRWNAPAPGVSTALAIPPKPHAPLKPPTKATKPHCTFPPRLHAAF